MGTSESFPGLFNFRKQQLQQVCKIVPSLNSLLQSNVPHINNFGIPAIWKYFCWVNVCQCHPYLLLLELGELNAVTLYL